MFGNVDWVSLGALFTVLLALFAFMKYVLYVIESRNAVWEARLEKVKADRNALDKELKAFKEEVYKNYVRNDELERAITEIRQDIGRVFSKIEELSAEVNRLIGAKGST
ncbi:MAG: hypothetical protein AAF354_10160 [Pseudomonadota bacterium]